MTGDGLPPWDDDTAESEVGHAGGTKLLPVVVVDAPPSDVDADAGAGAGAGEPSQFTHESKLPPIRLAQSKPLLAKGPTILALLGLGAAVAIAVTLAFSPPPSSSKAAIAESDETTGVGAVQLPDVIQAQQPVAPALPVVDGSTGSSSHGTNGQAHEASDITQSRATLRRAREAAIHDEFEKALGASLYANIDDPFVGEQRSVATSSNVGSAASVDPAGGPRSGAPTVSPGDQNLQGRKNDFLTQTDRSDGYLANRLVPPHSPYEVKAGTIIPTVLVTGINSDLPGTILGQVRENVYDSVTGNYLLIPQGSKLLASYDSMVAYGQERVLVCWQRLIRPDGVSLSLDCQPGVGLDGNAGFSDQVDHHWWRVVTGIALGSVLAAGIVAPQGNITGYVPTLGQGMAASAAGAVNQAGQQITTRALNIQPTIKIRPGFSVNVLVTKDLVLEPVRVDANERRLSP